ncbi:MAG: hypothetical protein QQN60_07250 [Nitrosopumilus sp.]
MTETEFELNWQIGIIIIILIIWVGSLFAVSFAVKKQTTGEFFQKLESGLKQCNSFCKESAGFQSIGTFKSFNMDGTANCLCVDMVVDNDTKNKNQLQAENN